MRYHLFVFADSDDKDLAAELRRLYIIFPGEMKLLCKELSLLT